MQAPQIFPKSYPDTVADAAAGSTIFVDRTTLHGDAFLVTDDVAPNKAVLVVRLKDGATIKLPAYMPARVVALGADTLDENW